MAYIGSWKIDDLLTFVANTHRFDTGAATDADSAPSYRVYEDETGTPLLTGSMATLDSANTEGFYSEQITLSAANGFEVGKSYSVYISATVNSVTGTMSHTFQMEAAVSANRLGTQAKADVNAEVVDTINTDTYAQPGQDDPPATTTLVRKLGDLHKAWRNKKDNDGTTTHLYADDGTTVDQKQTTSEAAGTVTKGEWSTGP